MTALICRPVSPVTLAILQCCSVSSARPSASLSETPSKTMGPHQTAMHPPATPRSGVSELIHGVRVEDPYRWLENDSDPEVASWVAAQDEYAQTVLASLKGRPQVAQLLRAGLYIDESSAPVRRKNRQFYWSRDSFDERPSYYYRDLPDGAPRLVLGPSSYGPSSSFRVRSFEPSPSGMYVACHIHVNDEDDSTLEVIEVETGELLGSDRIQGLRSGAISWTADSRGFFYIWVPRGSDASVNERIGRTEVRYHRLGTDPGTDVAVWTNPGEATSWPEVEVSEDGELVAVTFSRHDRSASRVHLARLTSMPPRLEPLAARTDAYYRVLAHRNELYVLTNEDAPRQRVFRAPSDQLDRAEWVEIVPQDAHATIQDIHLIGGHLVLRLLRNAHSELQVRALDGELKRIVPLPGIGVVSEVAGSVYSDEFCFKFESYARPPEIWEASVATDRAAVLSRPTVALGIEDVQTSQVFYTSKDGTRVSMFLVAKKGLKRSGNNPTLMYGYGGYGIPITPIFSPLISAWVELGGVYAEPNLRGGGEYGEMWHRGGSRENKQNVFDDFVAAAEWLIDEGYTSSEHLAIRGASNGGLLVGAVLTQRPELFGAASCFAPVIDMVRFHKSGAGMAWVDEYGNPEKPEDFRWLYRYSPYHAIKAHTSFPPVLIVTPRLDDRVPPMHGRKFAAALQWAQSGKRPILYRVEDRAGHTGTDMRQGRLQKHTDEVAFLMSHVGGVTWLAAHAIPASKAPAAPTGR